MSILRRYKRAKRNQYIPQTTKLSADDIKIPNLLETVLGENFELRNALRSQVSTLEEEEIYIMRIQPKGDGKEEVSEPEEDDDTWRLELYDPNRKRRRKRNNPFSTSISICTSCKVLVVMKFESKEAMCTDCWKLYI